MPTTVQPWWNGCVMCLTPSDPLTNQHFQVINVTTAQSGNFAAQAVFGVADSAACSLKSSTPVSAMSLC